MFSYYICDFAGLCRDHNALRGYPDVTSPLTAKLFNCNFRPLEVVSRRRDPQLQVSENYSDLTNGDF